MNRRDMLKLTVAGAVTGIAGCAGDEDPNYSDDNSTDDESSDGLEIVNHELTEEDTGYSTQYYIEGVVKNNDDELYDYGEIKTRIYDENDRQIGSPIDNISDLSAGAEWKFEVYVTQDEFARYEIAVEGSQY